jgi:hypothetical protein
MSFALSNDPPPPGVKGWLTLPLRVAKGPDCLTTGLPQKQHVPPKLLFVANLPSVVLACHVPRSSRSSETGSSVTWPTRCGSPDGKVVREVGMARCRPRNRLTGVIRVVISRPAVDRTGRTAVPAAERIPRRPHPLDVVVAEPDVVTHPLVLLLALPLFQAALRLKFCDQFCEPDIVCKFELPL